MKLMKKFVSVSLFFILSMAHSLAGVWGDNLRGGSEGQDLGDSSRNVASALFGISNLWMAISTIAGIGFLFVAIVKYHEHRKNPQQTPISQVFLMLFMAIALIGVYFVAEYGNTGYVQIRQLFEFW